MYDTQVLEILSEFKNNTFEDKKVYLFADLPEDYRRNFIIKAKNGNELALKAIIRGFWKYISKEYLSTVGTLPSNKINYELVGEQINDIFMVIHKLIMKNDLKRPLGIQIVTNVRYHCLTFRKKHEFSFRASKKQKNETIRKKMYIERVLIPIEDVQDQVIDDCMSKVEQNMISKCFLERLSEILDDIYPHPHQAIRKDIVKMWLVGKIHDCKYSYQHIGVFFGYSNETIRTIIDNFKTVMKQNGWREVLRQEGWNGS